MSNFSVTVWFPGKTPVVCYWTKTAAMAAALGDHAMKHLGAITYVTASTKS
jgi:hypothetical protein